MTEEEARAWLADRWPSASIDRLAKYVDLLNAGAERQNLISKASTDAVWARHIVDCAQLANLAGASGRWLDIGSGAGLPGVVISILTGDPVLMIEPRALRVAFLTDVVDALDLSARVTRSRIESIASEQADFISARAYAPLDQIFAKSLRFAAKDTKWILPKGRSAHSELEQIRAKWHGVFHVEQSVTDPDAGIVTARNVRPKGTR